MNSALPVISAFRMAQPLKALQRTMKLVGSKRRVRHQCLVNGILDF